MRQFASVVFLIIFFVSHLNAADLYVAVGGGNFNDATTWSTSPSGAPADGTVPTAGDNIFLNGNSGNLTINVNSVCRSIDCTDYTGVITHAAAVNLTIGDGTAGTGNVALKFDALMTYTLGNVTTSAIVFVSTAVGVQTIDWANKTSGNVTFNGTGEWQYLSSHTFASTGAITLTEGILDFNGQTVTGGSLVTNNANNRTLKMGSSLITLNNEATFFNATTVTNLTVTANTATINRVLVR